MEYDSHFLTPTASKVPRKIPSRQNMGTPGRSPVLASLAHELAAAVMSEPSDSRALADELGLEFEEEEEEESESANGRGLDVELGEPELGAMVGMGNYPATIMVDTPSRPGRNNILNGHSLGLDSDFDSSPSKPPPPPSFALSAPEVDPIETLKENVLFLDQFIVQLKNMDLDSTPIKPTQNSGRLSSIYPNAEPAVERLTSDMIRHIDETRREREDQLRDLMVYEREFRKIDSEPGGADRIGSVEPLEDVSLTDSAPAQQAYSLRALDAVPEDDYDDSWEAQQRDPRDVFDEDGDGDDPMFALRSPRASPYLGRRASRRSSLPPPPPYPSGPLTPSSTLPHLAHMRTVSQVLASSLSGLSEHVQVNGAAAAEAGRKLRSLKNRVTDLQAEWASAEQSIERIEKSEKGLDWEAMDMVSTEVGKRIDGRAVVKEISASFFAQLQQVEMRVQAMFPKVS